MSTQKMLRMLVFLMTLSLVSAGIVACNRNTNPATQAWIDFPRDGSTITSGSFVTVVSHAYAREGVAEVLLSVNGDPYRRDPPDETGLTFCEVRQDWMPDEAGLYTLQVKTVDENGTVSNPHGITINVVSEIAAAPTNTPTETAGPTDTPTLTSTPTETASPTNTPTHTSTPTVTPTPITPTSTSTPVTPTSTNTPTPTPPTPTLTPSPTIPPPDTTQPPVPDPLIPFANAQLNCRSSQTLVWSPVEDPSAITGYYVKLEKKITIEQWDSVSEWGPVPDFGSQTDIECGLFYRWSVRALDGAGNTSAWSAWSYFSVELE